MSANVPQIPEAATPRSEWWAVLRDATLEVFSTMVGVTVVVPQSDEGPLVVSERADTTVLAYVTGMIGIAGAVRAIFSLRCSDQSAVKMASQMLSIPVSEAAKQKADAIGEICNIIAGHFKHQLGLGDMCTLTVPSVVVGGHYSIHCPAGGERLEFPVIYDGDTVIVTLDIRS
jgi:chemotaxis protein CheX